MLSIKQNTIEANRTEDPREVPMSWAARRVCIFRGKVIHLGKPYIPAAQCELPTPGASRIVWVFPWVLYKVPSLGRTLHSTKAPRFPMRRSQAVPLTAGAHPPFSWAPVLLIPWGPGGISHSSARIPQFSAPEMFPPTFMAFPITSPRQGSPHLPSSA